MCDRLPQVGLAGSMLNLGFFWLGWSLTDAPTKAVIAPPRVVIAGQARNDNQTLVIPDLIRDPRRMDCASSPQ